MTLIIIDPLIMLPIGIWQPTQFKMVNAIVAHIHALPDKKFKIETIVCKILDQYMPLFKKEEEAILQDLLLLQQERELTQLQNMYICHSMAIAECKDQGQLNRQHDSGLFTIMTQIQFTLFPIKDFMPDHPRLGFTPLPTPPLGLVVIAILPWMSLEGPTVPPDMTIVDGELNPHFSRTTLS